MLRRLLAAALAAAVLVTASAVALAADPVGPTPPKPRPFVLDYYESGRWAKDVSKALASGRRAFLRELRRVPKRKKAAIVLDIDDTSLTQYPCRKPGDLPFDDGAKGVECIQEAALPPIKPTRRLYRMAQRRGVAVYMITGRPEAFRAATLKNLRAAGYRGRHTVVFRPADTNSDPSVVPYKSGARKELVRAGFDILVNVGDQFSDLEGGAADHRVKVANPMYFIP